MKTGILLGTAIVIGIFNGAAVTNITVLGTDPIFVAGRSDFTPAPPGPPPPAYLLTRRPSPDDPYSETLPSSLPVTSGEVIELSATGLVNYEAVGGSGFDLLFSPDGGTNTTGASATATIPNLGGISGYQGPGGALLGVFLDNSVPSIGPPPPTIDFTLPGSTSFTSLAPELSQIFYVGDGLTGTGTGFSQQFIAPAGGTRLFLGLADSLSFNNEPGYYNDNSGSFGVTVYRSALRVTNQFTSIAISNGTDRGDAGLSIDGNTETFSFLTSPNTVGLQTAYLFLGTAMDVNGFAWVKQQQDIDDRGENHIHSDLSIRISTDPIGTPLVNRSFLPVTGAVNGYGGGHQITGGVVYSDGTIANEFGMGIADGLSIAQATYGIHFQTVSNATAIAFRFKDRDGFTHYPAVEFYALSGVLPTPVLILNPSHSGNAIAFSFRTQAGFTHYVEYKNALSEPSWTVLTSITGNGATAKVTDSTANNSNHFYRVRTQ